MSKNAIRSEIYPAKCKRCGKEWETFHFHDTFQIETLPMKCSRCDEVKWVDIFEDEHYFAVFRSYSKVPQVTSEPWFGKFYREFEKTCMPCSCGGTFKIQTGVCPACDSSLVEVDFSRLLRIEETTPDYVKHSG